MKGGAADILSDGGSIYQFPRNILFPDIMSPRHDWVDYINACSTAVIAGFTILLFIGVVWQIMTSRAIERAWIMAELGWYPDGLHISIGSSSGVDIKTRSYTMLNIKLTCKNDGRSPAFVEHIFGRADRVQNIREEVGPEPPKIEQLRGLGDLDALGPGAERSRVLQMECDGQMAKDESISVYVVIVYRDIFGKQRTTSMGYTVLDAQRIYRQAAFPKRNTNT